MEALPGTAAEAISDVPELFRALHADFKKAGIRPPLSMIFEATAYDALCRYVNDYYKTPNYPCKTFLRIMGLRIVREKKVT